MKKPIDRRVFFKGCLSAASLALANPSLLAKTKGEIKLYSRARLVDQNDQPIKTASLKSKQCYVFNYPYVSTPCFLINLGQSVDQKEHLITENGQGYDWQGGVGPTNSIVSFAAICAHKLSYPTRTISFISYRPEQVLVDEQNQQSTAAQQVIYCCSERSVYDPLKGAKVLDGPAPEPLTTIILEHDVTHDEYYAIGTLGSEMYDRFFSRFEFNLALENQLENVAEHVTQSARVYHQSEYSEHLQSC